MPAPIQIIQPVLSALSQGADPFAALAKVYSTVEVRTALTPPISIDVKGLGEPSVGFSVARLLRPTFELSGPAGREIIAPKGTVSGWVGWLGFLGVLGLLVGTGVVIGRASKR